jgi:hypothetical protein
MAPMKPKSVVKSGGALRVSRATSERIRRFSTI